MSFVYTGPSWAASSFPLDGQTTSLAKEWGFPCINQSRVATTILDQLKFIPKNNTKPIVWVYGEPLFSYEEITGVSISDLIKRADWDVVRKQCNDFCLDAINALGVPVLIIGAHSDIVDCNYNNITVAHPSWQRYLAEQANMVVHNNKIFVEMDDGSNFIIDICWGAEVLHRFMHEHPEVTPSHEVTTAIWDIFFFWKELEKADLFFDVHPNYRGNKLFAEHLKPTVAKFLQENQ